MDKITPKNNVTTTKEILESVGFRDLRVEQVERQFKFERVQDFRNGVKGILPFQIPDDELEDFIDAVIALLKLGGHMKDNQITAKYPVLVGYAKKLRKK